MCLTEVGKLHRGLVGMEIDLEPVVFFGLTWIPHGQLTSVMTIPACPGFRHLTLRFPNGNSGVDGDRVVPNSLLVYVYCTGRKSILRPGSTDNRKRNT